MLMKVTMARGNLDLEAWLADRIKQDVKERYGIKIEIEVVRSEPEPKSKPTSRKPEVEMVDRVEDIKWTMGSEPVILKPSDVQRILGIGRRLTYEMLQDPPFPIQRLGGRGIIKISRDAFFRWLEEDDLVKRGDFYSVRDTR